MSEQNPPPATGQVGTSEAPRGPGPRVSRDQIRDVDRLRRSSTDRYVAGVAGGLGRHFDIDPTVVRVTLVVLTLFGGAGALLYGAVWLFVPEDGKDRAPVEVHGDALRAILVAAGVVAVMLALGIPFFGGGWGVPLPVLLIALLAVAIATSRTRRQHRDQPPRPWGGSSGVHPPAPSTPPEEESAMSVTDPYTERAGHATDPSYGQQPPVWMPPSASPYQPPPRPRRTGLVLIWPTLALVAIGLGTLGIVDSSNSVTASAYAALAVAITGGMLIVGAFRGRPGGLIALGLAGTLALGVTGVVSMATGDSTGDGVTIVPLTAQAVRSDYTADGGALTLDLTKVEDVGALAGRPISVHLPAGEITVLVPREVDVHVAANIRFAGEIIINGSSMGGVDVSRETTFVGNPASDNPLLELDVKTGIGQITIEQR